ncbi:MBOAT family protein [Glaciecola sp. MH2013]|uniref:MBOAT family O-acyltransferase n=1 Tax=Glaciecola sp. MH2013 TaxID=2785524 RepID=UPI00189FCEC1|nr:MBOAT family O-acyltransferase [Glaciecola sp. MH2013]MBF7072163.1 MBOAT family protein [Glaciecola sp. MH2013]
MIFSTFTFILLFLPIVFSLYSASLYFGRIQLSKIVLIIASLVFYAYGSGDFFIVFVIAVILNYFFGIGLSKAINKSKMQRLMLLWIAISLNLALLGYYKYTDFVLFNINIFIEHPIEYQNIILPIGISFFTFQLIAFLVDSYKGETKGYAPTDYLLFITFFPQLIVGPIVHHKDVVPQYQGLKKSAPDLSRISPGIFLFAIGCAKKLLIADPLSEWAQKAFDVAGELNSIESWVASLSYTLSYYFDLSGYADMAIGLGMIFGIALPINFNSPYKARNFADYWRRWHMTLSKFLGDYIFRNVYDKTKGSLNFYFALFVTFFVSGFWHGAGWTFVLWGIINGAFVIMSHMMIRANRSLAFPIAWTLTFIGVISTRVLFVANDFDDAAHVLLKMFSFSDFANTIQLATLQPLYLLVGMGLVLFFPNSNAMVKSFKPSYIYAISTSLLLLASFLNMSYVRGFLYFQF